MVITEPWVRIVSPKVKVLFGYRDAHARLEVLAPIGIVVPVIFRAPQIATVYGAFHRSYDWAIKPEEERKNGKGDKEEILDPRGKYTYEFPNGHVVIAVRVIAKITPWIPLELSREEVIGGKPIMEEVYQWTLLPQDVREMQSTLVS